MSITLVCLLLIAIACSNGLVFCSRIPSYSLGRPYSVQYDYTDDEYPFESDRYDHWPPPFYPTSYSRYPRQIIQRERRDAKEEVEGNIFTRLLNRINFLDFLANFNRFGGSHRKIRSTNSYRPRIRRRFFRRKHGHGHRPHGIGHRHPRSSGIGHRPGHFLYDQTYQPGPRLVTRLQNLLRNTVSETLNPVWSVYERHPLTQTPLLQPFYNSGDSYYPDYADYSSEDSNESRECDDSQESEESREIEQSRESDVNREIKNSRESNESNESIERVPNKAKSPNENSSSEETSLEIVPTISGKAENIATGDSKDSEGVNKEKEIVDRKE